MPTMSPYPTLRKSSPSFALRKIKHEFTLPPQASYILRPVLEKMFECLPKVDEGAPTSPEVNTL
jgi:hypothetical protein